MITVIIPTYNRCQNLKNKLDKLSECKELLEKVIVIDNASTDGTAEVSRLDFGVKVQYCKNDENIGLRGNLIKSFMVGSELKKGSLVWIMSDDDVIEPEILIELSEQRRQRKNLFFINHSVYKEGKVIKKSVLSKAVDDYKNLRDIFRVDGPQFMLLGSLVIDSELLRSLIERNRGMLERANITVPFRIGMLLADHSISIVNKPEMFLNDITETSWKGEARIVYFIYIPKDLFLIAAKRKTFSSIIDILSYFLGKMSKKVFGA